MNNERLMIGDRLNHLLDINGMVDKDRLLEEFGFAKSSLQKYLTNVRRPSLEDIIDLANIFNTSVDYLVQNTDYLLDTWDYEFLDEFEEFAKEKVIMYFSDRNNYTLTNQETRHVLLFGLVFNTICNGRTLEDFNGEEKEQFIATINTLVEICLSVFETPKSPNFNIAELQLLKENIQLFNDGDYNFTNEHIIDNLETNTQLERSEKISLLKSYLQQNIATTQRAINLLTELEGE
ncbi:helix-turn-helix domain-containing protein [Cytobacillus gottheilii]|uniref:helix-turn-helix domain-containing protein n=1 Tax=Cytobacillus gottheilii TaxID=859144 RepID=UPI0008321A11|nr:helix-turn-helix transcriptional regulator [Cytobacillus gottheilii]